MLTIGGVIAVCKYEGVSNENLKSVIKIRNKLNCLVS